MNNSNETAETIHNAGKAQLADSLRLMADNQRTLDATNNQDARLRDLHIREEEAEAKKRHPGIADPSPVKEEPVDIRVDSPTTVNHNYPAPASLPVASAPAEPAAAIRDHKPRRGWLLPAALVAGSVFSGGATGWMLAYQAVKAAAQPDPAPVVRPVPADENTLYELHLSKGE